MKNLSNCDFSNIKYLINKKIWNIKFALTLKIEIIEYWKKRFSLYN